MPGPDSTSGLTLFGVNTTDSGAGGSDVQRTTRRPDASSNNPFYHDDGSDQQHQQPEMQDRSSSGDVWPRPTEQQTSSDVRLETPPSSTFHESRGRGTPSSGHSTHAQHEERNFLAGPSHNVARGSEQRHQETFVVSTDNLDDGDGFVTRGGTGDEVRDYGSIRRESNSSLPTYEQAVTRIALSRLSRQLQVHGNACQI